jgi:hypothetical protein
MKRLLIAALLLVPLPALAGTTITVSVGTTTETWTLSDTDQQKFEAWVKYAYPCSGKDCTPLALTESEALWAKATLQGTVDNVTRFQNEVATKAALDATTPLVLTLTPDATKGAKKK